MSEIRKVAIKALAEEAVGVLCSIAERDAAKLKPLGKKIEKLQDHVTVLATLVRKGNNVVDTLNGATVTNLSDTVNAAGVITETLQDKLEELTEKAEGLESSIARCEALISALNCLSFDADADLDQVGFALAEILERMEDIYSK